MKKPTPVAPPSKAKVRKYLSADALMSGFAMFSLKDPSLLAFDERRKEEAHNLKSIYGIEQVPCDSSMREIIDAVMPENLRPAFLSVFGQLQRGKVLEPMSAAA